MPTITTQYAGDMLFETQIGNHKVSIDVPSGMGGHDRGPMPPQLFIASIGSCVAALVTEYCEHHNVDATGLTVNVSYEKADHPNRLTNIKATVNLPNATLAAKQAAVRRAADHCPVHETILNMPPMVIEIHDQNDLNLAEKPDSRLTLNE